MKLGSGLARPTIASSQRNRRMLCFVCELISMPLTVKNKTPLVVPPEVQRRAGLSSRAQLEFRASGGVITITAKPPSADEYTAEQRRMIDARLTEAKKGPYYGPFETADEAVKFLRKEIRSRKARRGKPTRA